MIRAGSMLSWPDEHYPNKIAIKFEGQVMTFRQINERINRLANGLVNIGLKRGDRVATLMYNSPRAIEVRFALMKAGLCMVPINIRQSTEETIYIVNHSETNLVILDQDYMQSWERIQGDCPRVYTVIVAGDAIGPNLNYEEVIRTSYPHEPEVMVSLDDLERIAYTSGTTGRPKGVMKTIGNDLARLRNDFLNQDYLTSSKDIMLNVAPLTHAARELFRKHYIKGACNLIFRRFNEEEILRAIQEEHVTAAMFVPTMIVRLILHPKVRAYDLTSLRRIYYGTSPIAADKLMLANEIFGNILRQSYGLTEATQPVLLLFPDDFETGDEEKKARRLISAGKPALGIEVRIVNEHGEEVPQGEAGEILIRGENVMKGYWRDPDATKEILKDDWLHTGDVAKRDEDGFIYIVDRKKEMIISGGFNIYPREVEQVIESHPAVAEASVIGIPDPTWGEAVKAVVVLKPGAQVTEEEIIGLCKAKIASYKKPRSVDFIKELPKNFQGKVMRRTLRDQYWHGHERKV
jgi:acyl-CoA synthetase (AMP-forming)/AMP-acid ligase II